VHLGCCNAPCFEVTGLDDLARKDAGALDGGLASTALALAGCLEASRRSIVYMLNEVCTILIRQSALNQVINAHLISEILVQLEDRVGVKIHVPHLFNRTTLITI
jgi:hypothetical protein